MSHGPESHSDGNSRLCRTQITSAQGPIHKKGTYSSRYEIQEGFFPYALMTEAQSKRLGNRLNISNRPYSQPQQNQSNRCGSSDPADEPRRKDHRGVEEHEGEK